MSSERDPIDPQDLSIEDQKEILLRGMQTAVDMAGRFLQEGFYMQGMLVSLEAPVNEGWEMSPLHLGPFAVHWRICNAAGETVVTRDAKKET